MSSAVGSASYEAAIKNINEKLEVLMKILNELVEVAKKKEAVIEESALAAGEKLKKLMEKCEGALKELLARLNELYVKNIPDSQKEKIKKITTAAKDRVTRGLLQVEDAFKAGGEAGKAQYEKVSEWTNEVKKQIGPGMEAARDYLNSYSPSAMEKASEALSSLSNNELAYYMRIVTFVRLLLSAMWILFTTTFSAFTAGHSQQPQQAAKKDE